MTETLPGDCISIFLMDTLKAEMERRARTDPAVQRTLEELKAKGEL